MSEQNFTVADFFRFARDVAAQESELRIKEADAEAERRIRLAHAGVTPVTETAAA
jgi:hypothetical protein